MKTLMQFDRTQLDILQEMIDMSEGSYEDALEDLTVEEDREARINHQRRISGFYQLKGMVNMAIHHANEKASLK